MSLTDLYRISIKTSEGFDRTFGYMNVLLKANSGSTVNVSMSSAPFSLAPKMTYISVVHADMHPSLFSGAAFQWTYQRGNSRSILLKRIRVMPVQNTGPHWTRTFCASGSIPSDTLTTLDNC